MSYREFGARLYQGRYLIHCIDDSARYHIWINTPQPGAPVTRANISENTLYKNPPRGTKSGDPGYFATKKLRADARAHAPLVIELLTRAPPLMEEARAATAREREEQRAQQRGAAIEGAKRQAGPVLYDALAVLLAKPDDPAALDVARDVLQKTDAAIAASVADWERVESNLSVILRSTEVG